MRLNFGILIKFIVPCLKSFRGEVQTKSISFCIFTSKLILVSLCYLQCEQCARRKKVFSSLLISKLDHFAWFELKIRWLRGNEIIFGG